MKINKSSWHYKSYKTFYGCFDHDVPNNLCGYFWGIMGVIFGTLLLTIICGLIIFALTLPLTALIYKYGFNPDTDLRGPSVVFGIELILLGIAGIVYLKNKNSFIRIIFEYFAAKKKKICPLIEFED